MKRAFPRLNRCWTGSAIIFPQLDPIFWMNSRAHISIGRDRSNRLQVAQCLRCGQMIAAAKERRTVEAAAARHSCDPKLASPTGPPSKQG